jgi:hypothetical protein
MRPALEVEVHAESHDSRVKQAQYVVVGRRYCRRCRQRLVDDENRIAVENIKQVDVRLKHHRFGDIVLHPICSVDPFSQFLDIRNTFFEKSGIAEFRFRTVVLNRLRCRLPMLGLRTGPSRGEFLFACGGFQANPFNVNGQQAIADWNSTLYQALVNPS